MITRIAILSLLILLAGGIETAAGQPIGDLTNRFVEARVRSVETAGKTRTFTFSIQDVSGSFNGFVLSGRATGDYRRGFVRFLENGRWTEWRPLRYLEGQTGPVFFAGYRDETYREGVPFELRFDTGPNDTIEIVQIGVFDNREDDDARIQQGEAGIEWPAGGGAVIPPKLIPRSEWGASPFAGNPVPLAQPSYNRMTFHHAACCAARTYEEGLAQVKAIQDFHQNVRGWSDIGYHFLFDQAGRLYQGRPFLDNRTDLSRPPVLAMGAHVGGANTGNIGVSLLGCYHPPEGPSCVDVASPALLDSVVTLYAYLSEQYRVDAANLLGHRDQSATACPRDNNYPLLPCLRDRIRELILTGNAPIAVAQLDASPGDAGVVRLSWTFLDVFDVAAYRIDRVHDGDTLTVFTSSDLQTASTLDASLPTGGGYEYHLLAVSSTGREQRLSTANVSVDQPAGFVLAAAFPNPTHGPTTLRYYMEHEGIVHLQVFDANGRLVQTLVDAFQEGDRWHLTRFDVGELAGGVYFYRLRVEGFSDIAFDRTGTLLVVR